MSNLKESLHAAYCWIDSAGEWLEAVADPEHYAEGAAYNATADGVNDVTESALLEAIEWYKANEAPQVSEPRSYKITAWANGETLELSWEAGPELRGWTRPSDGYRAIETNGDPIWEDSEGFEAVWEARSLCCRAKRGE